ncbi:MAG: septal ring lytic transglycosylase RlpA family protein [Bacteroidota bacterium]
MPRVLSVFAALALLAAATLVPVSPEPASVQAPQVAEASGASGPVVTVLPPLAPSPEAGTTVDVGQASYYGDELAGNPTASGERFDPDGLTAAHRTLPLGSRVRVVNEHTGESVVVRVNDRGPFAHGRVLDVSERAAREIGMLRRGTARVRVELLPRKKG